MDIFTNHTLHDLLMEFTKLGNNIGFIILCIIIIFDIVTGVLKAKIWNVIDSSIGLKGMIKHCLIIMIFVVIYPIFSLIGLRIIPETMCIIYILQYLLSILENFGVMGIYQPKFLKTKIQSEINKYEKQLENTVDENTTE